MLYLGGIQWYTLVRRLISINICHGSLYSYLNRLNLCSWLGQNLHAAWDKSKMWLDWRSHWLDPKHSLYVYYRQWMSSIRSQFLALVPTYLVTLTAFVSLDSPPCRKCNELASSHASCLCSSSFDGLHSTGCTEFRAAIIYQRLPRFRALRWVFPIRLAGNNQIRQPPVNGELRRPAEILITGRFWLVSASLAEPNWLSKVRAGQSMRHSNSVWSYPRGQNWTDLSYFLFLIFIQEN